FTHGRDTNGLSSATRRPGTLPRRVLARSLAAIPAAAVPLAGLPLAGIPFSLLVSLTLLSACAQDPVGVQLGPPGSSGGGGTAQPIPEDDSDLIRRCGSDGIKCGEGCC